VVLLPTSGTQRLLELRELAASQPLAAETLLAGGVGIANQTRSARNATHDMLKVPILRTPSRLAGRCSPLLLTPSPFRLRRMEPLSPHCAGTRGAAAIAAVAVAAVTRRAAAATERRTAQFGRGR